MVNPLSELAALFSLKKGGTGVALRMVGRVRHVVSD